MNNQKTPGRGGERPWGTPRMPANQANQQQQANPEGLNPPANLNAVPPPNQPIVPQVGPNQQRPAFNPVNQQQRGPAPGVVPPRLVGPVFAQQPEQTKAARGSQQAAPQPIVLIHKEVDSLYRVSPILRIQNLTRQLSMSTE